MRLRSILLGCLLLIVVALAAAATLLFVRPSAYRGPVERILSAALGSPVKIEGSFELDPGPSPRIQLSKLSIGPRSPDGPPVGRIGRLELEVVLAKLFLGVLDVRWLGLFDTQLAFVSSGKDTSTDAASSKSRDFQSSVFMVGISRRVLGPIRPIRPMRSLPARGRSRAPGWPSARSARRRATR